jgi:hypothetical protein
LLRAWLYVFGQFLDHDIDLEETPPTSIPIDMIIPENDQFLQVALDRASRLSPAMRCSFRPKIPPTPHRKMLKK